MRGLFGAISAPGAAPARLRAMLGPWPTCAQSCTSKSKTVPTAPGRLVAFTWACCSPLGSFPAQGRCACWCMAISPTLGVGRWGDGASVALVRDAYETDPASMPRTVHGRLRGGRASISTRRPSAGERCRRLVPAVLDQCARHAAVRAVGTCGAAEASVSPPRSTAPRSPTISTSGSCSALERSTRACVCWDPAAGCRGRGAMPRREKSASSIRPAGLAGGAAPGLTTCEATRSGLQRRGEQGGGNRPALAMSLSGGLDSRAILSALAARPVTTYTVGVRRCADDDIARRLSALGRTRHVFAELGDKDLRDFVPNLERVVSLSDGFYLSHGLTEMAALEAVRERRHAHAPAWPLRGAGQGEPGVAASHRRAHLRDAARRRRPKHTWPAGSTTSRTATSSEACSPTPGYATWTAPPSLRFTRRWKGLDLHPADVCSYLYLHEHHRRFTVPSLELFRHETEVRLPFADKQFLRVLLQGPPEWRDGTDIHRHITGVNNRRMLAVRNSNTGCAWQRARHGSSGSGSREHGPQAIERARVPALSQLRGMDAGRAHLLGRTRAAGGAVTRPRHAAERGASWGDRGHPVGRGRPRLPASDPADTRTVAKAGRVALNRDPIEAASSPSSAGSAR